MNRLAKIVLASANAGKLAEFRLLLAPLGLGVVSQSELGITAAPEPYPSFIEGKVHIIDRMLDTNPYVAFGQYMHGCLTRISTDALVNVTSGGGSTVPTFLVEPR